jgi:hypothetical protein
MRNIIVIPKRKGPVKDPIPLDDGRFPGGNMQKRYNRYRSACAHQRFGPPAMGPREMKGVYDASMYMNSLQEVTIAFKDNRKFI